MRVKAIINPVSGPGKMRKRVAKLCHLLQAEACLFKQDIAFTQSSGTDMLERNFFSDCDLLLVAGGDGTLHYVINMLLDLNIDCPLAYFPTGTINDFGTALKLPRTPATFLAMLHNHEIKTIDIGRVNDRYFHYVVASGAISSISYTTKQKLKNKIGRSAYYLAALKNLPKLFKGDDLFFDSAEFSGQEQAILVLVSNSPGVAGFRKLFPEAQFDDAFLHVLIIKKSSIWQSLQILIALLRGKHLWHPRVRYFKTRKIAIKEINGLETAFGIDGEKSGVLPLEICIIAKRLRLIVPKNAE